MQHKRIFLKSPLLILPLFLMSLFLMQCNEDDDTQTGLRGQLQIELTDAPVDDAAVKGVFVTVAEVKIDGKEVEGFQRTTIDLTAYRNGSTAVLGLADVEARTYNELTLVLDHAQDANGNAPGCYVLKDGGQKDALGAAAQTTQEIKITGSSFAVQENAVTQVVADFDLRKSIRRDGAADYNFVTAAELATALRLVAKSQTGTIKGACSNWDQYADKVIVYVYKKGTFNASTEVQGQGESKVRFKNAVTSALVANNGQFQLHFLPAGEYEVYFAGYEDNNNDGVFELSGSLSLDLLNAIDLSKVTVTTGASVDINLTVKGILPL